MTRVENKQRNTTKQGYTFFTLLIDALILVYTVSIYTMSYNSALNKYSKLLAFALMGCLAIYVLAEKKIRINGFICFFAGFIIFSMLSYFWAADKSATLSKVITLMQIWILLLLLYNYLKKENKVDFLLFVLCIAGTFFSIYVVFYFGVTGYFSGLADGIRMGGEIANENTVGMVSASSAILLLWYVFYKRKYWYVLFVAVCTVVALGSGSRKALLALVLGILMLFVLKGNSKKRLKSIFQCLIVLVIFYMVLQLPVFSTINERFEMMINGLTGNNNADNSTLERMRMINIGFEQFLKTPFQGLGLGNSGILTDKYLHKSTYLHNNYVELLSTVGIIGTALYYTLFLIPLIKLVKPALKGNSLAIISLVLLLIQLMLHWGAVEYYSKSAYLQLMLYSIVAERIGDDNESYIQGCEVSE